MDLIERARHELARLDEDPDLIEPLIKVVKIFQEQAFDAMARGFAVEYLHLLLQAKPLSVLTDNPAEWEPVYKADGEGLLWISRRDPDAFSTDKGKTFWLKSDAQLCDPEPPPIYTTTPWDHISFPETYRDALKLKKTSMEQPDPVSPSGGVDDAGSGG